MHLMVPPKSKCLSTYYTIRYFELQQNQKLIFEYVIWIPTKKQNSHVNWEKDMEAPDFFQVRNPN